MLDKGVFETLKAIDLSTTYVLIRHINSLMFTKCKFDAKGFFVKWKARLAARGDRQDESLFGNGGSSPTANLLSINTLLSIATTHKMIIWTSDVPGAYLHADLEEIIIMRLPKSCTNIWLDIIGIPESERYLYTKNGYAYVRLRKALYGLIQSSLLWYENITATLRDFGFESCINDPCIFQQSFNGNPYYIGLYVDDLIHICSDVAIRDKIANMLVDRYGSMDHHFGNQLSFLSISILVDFKNDRLIMDQDEYVRKFLESIDDDCGSKLQQYPTPATFEKDINGSNEMELASLEIASKYRSYLMSIMLVALRTRPDVLFATSVLSSKASRPTINDWNLLVYLIGYLRAFPTLQIIYTSSNQSRSNWNKVELYIDASWCLYSDAKGQSGCILKLFGNTIMFKTSKQTIVTKSSTESEIVAVDDYLPYGIWLMNLLRELGQEYECGLIVYQDNTSGVKIINKGHGNFKRTKHFINKFYWIKQFVDDGSVEFKYLATDDMIADFFTKSITGLKFYTFIGNMIDPNLKGG